MCKVGFVISQNGQRLKWPTNNRQRYLVLRLTRIWELFMTLTYNGLGSGTNDLMLEFFFFDNFQWKCAVRNLNHLSVQVLILDNRHDLHVRNFFYSAKMPSRRKIKLICWNSVVEEK